jgi:hypothetical protein
MFGWHFSVSAANINKSRHASFTVEDFKSLNERLKPKPVNAAEY